MRQNLSRRGFLEAAGTLFNNGQDDIGGDEFGLATARNLGRRVAEVAVRVHQAG